MATSSRNEIRDDIAEAVSDSAELRSLLMGLPERIEKTVESLTPYLTGETVKSITTTHRKTPYKRLSTRRIKIGEVYSDDDPERVGAIEYGRHAGEHGEAPEWAMFRRAASILDASEL